MPGSLDPIAPLEAALAAPALFILPGLAFVATLRRTARDELRLDERLFLIVALSVGVSAWIALLLAEWGVFSTPRAAIVAGFLSLALFVARRHRLASPVAAPFGANHFAREALPGLVVALGAFGLFAQPSEYIVGGRDPGSYVATMGVIGRTGAISHVDPVVRSIPAENLGLFFANPELPPFRFSLDTNEEAPQAAWPRFMGFELDHPKSGRVTPQFFHLFPAFGAYLFQTMGVKGALATPPIFGVLGAVATYLLGRRIFGTEVAFAGALLLITNVVQVWFARYPASETMSQFLILGGLFVIQAAIAAASRSLMVGGASLLGLTFLVRIDGVLLLAPLGLALLFHFAVHKRSAVAPSLVAAAAIPLSLLLSHAGLHAAFFSTRYAHQVVTRKYWNQSPFFWAALGVGVAALVWTSCVHGERVRSFLAARSGSIRSKASTAVLALFAYAFFLRGPLSACAGGDGNPPALKLEPSRALDLLRALDFHRLAAHDAQALVRLSWFVGLPALLLAVWGFVAWIRRAKTDQVLPLLVLVSFAGFYLYKIRVFNDYFFAMRRYVPVTIPFVFLLAAVAIRGLAGATFGSRMSKGRTVLVSVLAGLTLAASAGATARLGSFSDWKGSVRFVADFARRFGPEDVVIFEQPKTVHLLSLPLWALHGVNAIEFRRFNPDPDSLAELVRAWRQTYRNIYFVNSYRTDVCGLFLERVQPFRFASFEWEWTYDRVPSKAEPRIVDFALSRVVSPEDLRLPLDQETDIGGSGDPQISGFYEREALGERTYRWSGACLDAQGQAVASVYLPAVRPGRAIEIEASAFTRPETARAPVVTVTLGETLVGQFEATAGWTTFALKAPPGESSRLLRLSVPAWRPANTDAGSTDTRDLGVMVDRIRVLDSGGNSKGDTGDGA
jgi:hypothetical protein